MKNFVNIFIASVLMFSLCATNEFKTLQEVYDFWAHDYKTLVNKTSYSIAEWFTNHQTQLPLGECLVLDRGGR